MATEKPEAVSRERIRGEADNRRQGIQARLRLESEEVEKSTLIRVWQDETVEQPFVSSGGIISRLFDGCINLLRDILKRSKDKDQFHGDHLQLQDSLLALTLWSDDHHLSNGKLDTRLHGHEELQELICSLLLSLADLLVNGLLQHIVAKPSERHAALFKYNMLSLMHEARKDASSVESPVDYTRDTVSDMTATLATLVDCLISLNPSLEQSAKDDHDGQPNHYTVIQDKAPHLYHMELIRSKFPDASKSLLERLGKCNWERYKRLQQQREEIKDENFHVGETESKSIFDDSALGTSVPAQSDYAETTVSSRAASSHQKLPKLPKEGLNGRRFICEICNTSVAIRSSRDWKKHVFQDILAYTCIYEECGVSLWEDSVAMTNHLAVEHGLGPEWKSRVCPLCKQDTGEGKELISLHISRHMEEIALNALPSIYESDSESEADSAFTDSGSSSADYPRMAPPIKPESLPEPKDDSSEDSPVPNEYKSPPVLHLLPPSRGILREPTEKFSEDPSPIREGVAPMKDEKKGKDIPSDARWTKIDRRLVNPQALEEHKERFEERKDCVIVLRVLTREDIQRLADRTRDIREAKGSSVDHVPNDQIPVTSAAGASSPRRVHQHKSSVVAMKDTPMMSDPWEEYEEELRRHEGDTRSNSKTYPTTTQRHPVADTVDDSYSYTDAARMYRDTEPSWRNRSAAPLSTSPRGPHAGNSRELVRGRSEEVGETEKAELDGKLRNELYDQHEQIPPTVMKEGSRTAVSPVVKLQRDTSLGVHPDEPTPSNIIRPYSKLRQSDDIRKKNARFEIPPERTLLNIDRLIAQSTNEEETMELKQQKRLLRNRQAALDARDRKRSENQPDQEQLSRAEQS